MSRSNRKILLPKSLTSLLRFQMMNSSREWNFPAVMTAKRLLMKSVSTFFFTFVTQKIGGYHYWFIFTSKIGSATSAKGQSLI